MSLLSGSKNQESKSSALKQASLPGSREGGMNKSSHMLSEAQIASGPLEIDQNKYIDIGLNDPYEDDDFNIYFDRAQLMAHIDHLEGDSLFKINLVSEEEQNVEKIKKQAEVEFAKV